MSASKKPNREANEELFEEPDYDRFTDEQLDALYRGESIDSVKKNHKSSGTPTSTGRIAGNAIDEAANEDFEPEEIDPKLERELRAELGEDEFDDDSDWDALDDDFDEL